MLMPCKTKLVGGGGIRLVRAPLPRRRTGQERGPSLRAALFSNVTDGGATAYGA